MGLSPELIEAKQVEYNKLIRALTTQRNQGNEHQPPLEPVYNKLKDETEMLPVACYITSRSNVMKNTTPGKVSLVPVGGIARNGSIESIPTRCMTEGTHQLSTKEEVQRWKQDQVKQKKQHDAMDVRRTNLMRNPNDADLNPMPEHLRSTAAAMGAPAEAKPAETKTADNTKK